MMILTPRAQDISEALLHHYIPPPSDRRQVYTLSAEEEPPFLFSSPDPHYHHQYQDYNNYGGGNDGGERENREREETSYAHVKNLEQELRRKNPDLLDKIRFAMDDRHYGVFLKLLGQGAFWGAAMYAVPLLMIPVVAARAIGHSRLKQISRRDMGIPPRYHLRPDDTY